MNANARDIITAAINAAAAIDPTIMAEHTAAALDALQGKSAAGIAKPEPIDRVLPIEAVCEMCNLSRTSLRSYAQKGEIKRVYFGGKKRSWGYWESSVRDFLKRAAQN